MADSKITSYYPPVGFLFRVSVLGFDMAIDAQFQSVSGLSVDVETEEFTEGGENRFKHKLPVRTKYPNLVLKRGLVSIDSELMGWCREAVEDFKFSPRDISISMLNEDSEPLFTWKLANCYPIKWAVDDLNSSESKIVMETLELSYNYFEITKGEKKSQSQSQSQDTASIRRP